MSLGPGRRLGPYEVLSPLGAGGMGQVWRARDTRLGRDVALKALPDEVAGNAERRSRFDQEARLLAALNHPSIAALFDVLELEGSPVLVMEVVEGETLAERISRGPIALKTSIEIALSIAEALEAAHERGILHRDLKPSNVKLTPEGAVKILDFGLAKALEGSESAVTLPKPVERTGTGVAIGTAPYMSPEQARGEAVNKKTDVWAFGCLVYEMLTGRRAFPGATWSDSIAAVLAREPDWSRLPTETPHALQRLLKRCLQKEQRERLRDFADTKLELKDLLIDSSAGAPTAVGRAPRRQWRVAFGAIVGLAAFGAFLVLRRPPSPSGETAKLRYQLTLPHGVGLDFNLYSTLAISPDGSQMAFVGCRDVDVCQLYLRNRSEVDARPLPGTEGAGGPFFSPDGRWLGFVSQQKLKKIELESDTVVTLTEAPTLRGASWADDGTIVFSTPASGLLRLSAEGGDVEQITKVEPGEFDHRWPQVLPGGRAILFHVVANARIDDRIDVVDLENETRRALVERASCPKYAVGHVLFGRGGVVYAAPFDPERLELRRPPVPVLENVAMWNSPSSPRIRSGVVAYDVARDGSLLFSSLEARLPKRTLVALDRKGERKALSPSQRAYFSPRFSPDGRRVAVTVQADVSVRDPFLLDHRSGAWTRVDVQDQTSTSPGGDRSHYVTAWMPDGERLVIVDRAYDGLLRVHVDGREPPETIPFDSGPVDTSGITVSPDGRTFLIGTQSAESWNIERVSLAGERALEPWLVTPNQERRPRFSPDGGWVAYSSLDSGRWEIYVRPVGGTARHQVSTGGGIFPEWARHGREIFFVNDGSLWSAPVRTSPTFTTDPPQKLFDLAEDLWSDDYDVTPDGEKFVMVQKDSFELRAFDLVVIPNWVEEMKSRLAAAK